MLAPKVLVAKPALTCPVSVYEIKDGKSFPVRVEDCILCRTCESQCPEGAIQVFEAETEPAKVGQPKVEKAKRALHTTLQGQLLNTSSKSEP